MVLCETDQPSHAFGHGHLVFFTWLFGQIGGMGEEIRGGEWGGGTKVTKTRFSTNLGDGFPDFCKSLLNFAKTLLIFATILVIFAKTLVINAMPCKPPSGRGFFRKI